MSPRQLLNQSINFFWTILCFAPVLWYWVAAGVTPWFYISLGAALVVGVLPGRAFDALTVGRSRRFYERLGVKGIRRWVQDGDAVQRMSSRREGQRGQEKPAGPETEATKDRERAGVIGDLDAARRYLRMIAMYERFHWMCFIFCLLTAVLCLAADRWVLGLLVTAANVLFNVLAILLQQYNRLRIRRVLGMTGPRR